MQNYAVLIKVIVLFVFIQYISASPPLKRKLQVSTLLLLNCVVISAQCLPLWCLLTDFRYHLRQRESEVLSSIFTINQKKAQSKYRLKALLYGSYKSVVV